MQIASRTLLSTALALCVTGAALAERGDDADRKSKNGRAEGVVDGVEVVVEYGRPNVNGREIWGGLVPYGEVWRTGANEATTIHFSADVIVEGVAVAAGTYALFTLPEADSCTILFNSEAEQWGAFDYDSAKDVASITVTPEPADFVETFEISVEEGGVALRWAEVAIEFNVEAAG
jgi:hypothetical protein